MLVFVFLIENYAAVSIVNQTRRGYAAGLTIVVLLLAMLISGLIIEFWIVSCIRILGFQIPLQVSESGDIIHLRQREGPKTED